MRDLQRSNDRIPGGMHDFLTEFQAAKRLMPDVRQEAGTRYEAVVRRCIQCDFDQREYDLGNEAFCQAVYENVVLPLEENVEFIDGREALLAPPFGYAK